MSELRPRRRVRVVPTYGPVLRASHAANVVLLAGLWWSGLLIEAADRRFVVDLAGHDVGVLYPGLVHDVFDSAGRLAEGIAWHLVLAWFFVANGLLWLALLALGGWRRVLPRRGALTELAHELRHLRQRPAGYGADYGAAQRFAYTAVLVMAAGAVLTGIALWKPVRASTLVAVLGGYQAARTIHLVLSALLVLFVAVHLVQVARAGWNRARAVVVGYEVHPEHRDRDQDRDQDRDPDRGPA